VFHYPEISQPKVGANQAIAHTEIFGKNFVVLTKHNVQ